MSGEASAGSQLQMQRYVNDEGAQAILNAAITAHLPELQGSSIEWRSPLASEAYKEYWGTSFLGALDLQTHAEALKALWPNRGPQWDGLAVVNSETRSPGVVLVEAKSYPRELAEMPGDRSDEAQRLITKSFSTTRKALGASGDPATWFGERYQLANRLAHLVWLNETCGVDAWLVYLLFTGDPHGTKSNGGVVVTAAAMTDAFDAGLLALGLSALPERTAAVVLPALPS